MSSKVVESVIAGNIEALDQGIELVNSLSDTQYSHVASPYVTSSIGQHFRHLVDLFNSVVEGIKYGDINYDIRRRGAQIETSRACAVSELTHIKKWMANVASPSAQGLLYDEPVTLTTEVTLKDTNSVSFQSSLLRELVFASSHAVHHYAIIGIIAKLQGVHLDRTLGVAPATASYLREQSVVHDVEFNAMQEISA